MNTRHLGLLFAWLTTATCTTFALDLPQAMLTLSVVDESAQPVAGANAGITFEQIIFGRGVVSKPVEGVTDSNGQFSATGGTTLDVYYGASKTGYYRSTNYEFEFKGEPENGRWQPWNPMLTVVLKKIINPVPMYAKRVRVEIPVEKTPIGFDLQEADWVAPHGKGCVADFVFQLTRRFASRKDYEVCLRLSFTNDEDGIQSVFASQRYGSELRLPHNAPVNAYEKVWERTNSYSNPARVREDQNYFFRVRTKVSDGKIRKAFYGKIHGDIRVAGYGAPKPIIVFTYYLNPDGKRNVEFDPKRNLFNNLKQDEEVRDP